MSTATAERLVATVARAFYPDDYVVVLDALVREKYIREEEIGPRLKLPDKDVKKILNQLHEEMMVRMQELTMEDGRPSRCWYIDYQLFVHVVRYRVHLIQRELTSKEKLELNHIFFQCPTCKEKYTELQVQRLISKDFKFICGHCCPYDDLRSTISEPYFRLMEHDRGGKLTDVQLLSKKMGEQMNAAEGLHSGIYDLLSDLRDENIIRNLPSDNIKRGIKSSKITDEDILQRMEETAASAVGGGVKRKAKAMETPSAEEDIVITYTDSAGVDNNTGDGGAPSSGIPSSRGSDMYRANVQSSLPEHLQGGSRVQAATAARGSAVAAASGSVKVEEEADDEDWED